MALNWHLVGQTYRKAWSPFSRIIYFPPSKFAFSSLDCFCVHGERHTSLSALAYRLPFLPRNHPSDFLRPTGAYPFALEVSGNYLHGVRPCRKVREYRVFPVAADPANHRATKRCRGDCRDSWDGCRCPSCPRGELRDTGAVTACTDSRSGRREHRQASLGESKGRVACA